MSEERKQRHITKEEWMKYAQGTMSEREEEYLYTHVGCCTYCAEQFANIVEMDFFVEPPKYLCEEIVERSKKVDIQAAITAKETSKKMRLLFYSLKVGFAVAASIFLLTVTSNVQQGSLEPPKELPKKAESSITRRIHQRSSRITSGLQDVTNKIFHIQVKEE
ncbi:MAG: hypothetical protein HFI37_04750 [Lachnospiraceae bacterium]|nr:hypothetical protein [Lachnospiraceae bacterium]